LARINPGDLQEVWVAGGAVMKRRATYRAFLTMLGLAGFFATMLIDPTIPFWILVVGAVAVLCYCAYRFWLTFEDDTSKPARAPDVPLRRVK
jgi:hypothetical protein